MLDEKDLQAIRSIIREEVKEEVTAAEERISQSTMVMMESYFGPKFNLLVEGQQAIRDAMIPKSRVENLEDEVAFMKQVIKAMSQDIAELKKAQ